jgi:hypothetical protein
MGYFLASNRVFSFQCPDIGHVPGAVQVTVKIDYLSYLEDNAFDEIFQVVFKTPRLKNFSFDRYCDYVAKKSLRIAKKHTSFVGGVEVTLKEEGTNTITTKSIVMEDMAVLAKGTEDA